MTGEVRQHVRHSYVVALVVVPTDSQNENHYCLQMSGLLLQFLCGVNYGIHKCIECVCVCV